MEWISTGPFKASRCSGPAPSNHIHISSPYQRITTTSVRHPDTPRLPYEPDNSTWTSQSTLNHHCALNDIITAKSSSASLHKAARSNARSPSKATPSSYNSESPRTFLPRAKISFAARGVALAALFLPYLLLLRYSAFPSYRRRRWVGISSAGFFIRTDWVL